MEALSKRIVNMSASATVAMNQKSKDLQSKGFDIINLSVGEPDFPTPDHIKDAAKEAIDANFTYYSPVPGYPELLNAISYKMKTDNGLTYSTSEIIASNGAKHALANVIMCLVDDGDEVIIPAPYWVSYIELVKLAGGKPVVIEGDYDTNYKVTAEQIEKAITPRTKALVLCSPSNPTGSIYTQQELAEIAKVIEKHTRVFVLSDEIYEYINFVGKHESIAQFQTIKDRVVIINGVSKGYAMTGWRIGYICAPGWLVKACDKLQGQFTTGPCSISQMASVTALNAPKTASIEMTKAFKRRRDLVMSLLSGIKDLKLKTPDGAFYIFPDVSNYFGKSFGYRKINNASDVSLYLLEEALVATVPGDAFGAPKNIRLSYASDDKLLEKAMLSIKDALNKLV